MAKFAKLNENDIVLEVQCVANEELLDDSGNEIEAKGIAFLTNWSGGHTNWVQTNIHSLIRKNYSNIGYTYDRTRDAFIAPKPFNSWILNEETCQWEAPVPYPSSVLPHYWNEETLSWNAQESYPILEGDRTINDLPVTTIGN